MTVNEYRIETNVGGFVLIGADSVELSGGCLVFKGVVGNKIAIFAPGQWKNVIRQDIKKCL